MSKSKTEKVVETATVEPLKAFETLFGTGKVQFDSAVKMGTEAAEKAMALSKERLEKAVKSFDEANTFGKQTVEAFVSAGQTTAKGLETLNAETLAFAKAQFESGVAASKAVFAAKTLPELIEAQTLAFRSLFEGGIAQSTRMGEMASKIAQDAFAPVGAQFQAAAEKFAKPLTA